MVFSVGAHVVIGAGLAFSALPVETREPDLEAMAISVQFVAEPQTGESEEPAPAQTTPKGSRLATVTEPVMPQEEIAEPEPVEEPAETETFMKLEEVADSVPLPLRRPKPENPAKEQVKTAALKGSDREPKPDMPVAEEMTSPASSANLNGQQLMQGKVVNAKAQDRWQLRLAAHLERRKRYPREAISRHQEGEVHVRFFVAADGSVNQPELVQSSGVPELDAEVVELVQRASPVPKPPPEVNTLVVVPISFSLRR